MHNVVAFTWGGFILVTLIGFWVRNHKSAGGIFAGSVLASVVFYIVSNFGVWLMGWYPRDAQGLVNCYVMALPFLRTFTVATVVYSCAFFGVYALIARSVKATRFAKVLLES